MILASDYTISRETMVSRAHGNPGDLPCRVLVYRAMKQLHAQHGYDVIECPDHTAPAFSSFATNGRASDLLTSQLGQSSSGLQVISVHGNSGVFIIREDPMVITWRGTSRSMLTYTLSFRVSVRPCHETQLTMIERRREWDPIFSSRSGGPFRGMTDGKYRRRLCGAP